MNKIFLGLGSNIGNREKYILHAIQLLKTKISDIEYAGFYETKPLYFEKQADFLNTVLKGTTSLSPDHLLRFIKKVQTQTGRVKRFKYGPREVDIDILFYNNLIHNSKNLTIPHPLLQEREFVLKPFLEIEPGYIHPILKKTIKDLYLELK